MGKKGISAVSAPAPVADTSAAARLLQSKLVEVARGDLCFPTTCRLTSHHMQEAVGKHGTAVLIAPDLAITVAHNLFDPDVFGKVREGYCGLVDLTPGYAASGQSAATTQSTYSVAAHKGFTDDGDVAFDLAMILLPAPYTHTNKFPKPVSRRDSKFSGMDARVVGFPVDRKPLAMMSSGGGVKGVEDTRLFYLVTTAPGESGGPVMDADGEAQELLGLHAYDNEQTPSGLQPAHAATRFSDDLILWLNDAEQHLRSKR